jgi:hypothetical protein
MWDGSHTIFPSLLSGQQFKEVEDVEDVEDFEYLQHFVFGLTPR